MKALYTSPQETRDLAEFADDMIAQLDALFAERVEYGRIRQLARRSAWGILSDVLSGRVAAALDLRRRLRQDSWTLAQIQHDRALRRCRLPDSANAAIDAAFDAAKDRRSVLLARLTRLSSERSDP